MLYQFADRTIPRYKGAGRRIVAPAISMTLSQGLEAFTFLYDHKEITSLHMEHEIHITHAMHVWVCVYSTVYIYYAELAGNRSIILAIY